MDEDLADAVEAAAAELQRVAALLRDAGAGKLPRVTRRRKAREDELTLARACQLYREWGERTGQLKPATRDSYRAAAGWAARVAREVYDPLRSARLLEARDALLEHVAAVTAKRIMSSWRAAWRWAKARELCESDWPADVAKPRAKRTRKAPYSLAELEDLLAWSRTRANGELVHLVLWVLVESAARSGEVCALRRRDVALREDGCIVVQLHQPKQERSRTPVLSPELSRALADRLDRAPEDLLLCWPDGRPLKPRWLSAVVMRWSRARGLVGLRDPHSLRRSGCARLGEAGVPTDLARRVVGHASIAQHAVYTELAEYDLEPAQRTLWLSQRKQRKGVAGDRSSRGPVGGGPEELTISEPLARAAQILHSALEAADTALQAVRSLLQGGPVPRPP